MAMFIVQKAAVAPLIISLCAGSSTAVCLSVLFTVCCHLNHVGSVCNLFIYLFNWHLLQIRLPWIHICVADGTALLYGCHQQRTSIWRSWRIFKQHKARHSDLSGLCVCACVCVQYISLFFFWSQERVWQGWLHLWSLMKLEWCAKEAFIKMYMLNY